MKKCNYHTHTYRCKHASQTDEDYVLEAIKAGYDVLGFADHTPWNYRTNYVSRMRMDLTQLEEYIYSIRTLKEKYKDQIKILVGLEVEYFPDYMDWLLDIKKKYNLDYLIFGNHFDESDEYGAYFGTACRDDEMLKRYVASSLVGMKSGHFLYFAHPDLYMRYRRSFSDKAKEAAYAICKCAKECNIPLEYNLEGVQGKVFEKGTVGYPCLDFWKIAKEVGNDVIIGVDAHKPESLSSSCFEEAYALLKDLGLNIIDEMKMDA